MTLRLRSEYPSEHVYLTNLASRIRSFAPGPRIQLSLSLARKHAMEENARLENARLKQENALLKQKSAADQARIRDPEHQASL